MSKLKISFSALIMLIVISMFSTMAFAAAPAAPTGLDASITGKNEIRATWTRVGTDATVSTYKVYVNDVEKAIVTQTTDASKITVLNAYIPVGAELAANEKATFTVKVSAINAGGEESTKTQATPLTVVLGTNGILSVVADDAGKDNGVNNANQSGVGVGGQNVNTGVLKSNNMVDNHGEKGAQRTHGEYQNNTNSCASCHQTHTASAKSLLFKDGVYSTCTACHDGTLGFYNVFGNGDKASSAGTFGGTHDGNMSVHLADGAVKMKAAPGGNPNGTGTWDKEFNCASCHAPHGSYSDRLLHYNPNNMGAETPDAGGIKAGGYKAKDDTKTPAQPETRVQVVAYDATELYTGQTTRFIGVKGTKTQHGLTEDKYPYNEIGPTDVVIMIYEKAPGATKYTKTTNPWIYGYPTRGTTGNNHYYYTRFFTKDPATTGFINPNGTYPTAQQADVIDHYDYLADTAHIKYGYGLVWGTADSDVAKATFAEVSRAYVVKLDLMPILDPAKDLAGDKDGNFDPGEELTFGEVKITTVNQKALFDGTTNKFSVNIKDRWGIATPGTDKASNWGVAMSNYCASCHTDYLAKSGATSGTFDKTSYRHTTNSDTYTCVRCHFAHGTDVEIMTDAHVRNKAEVATDLKAYNPALTDAEVATLAKEYMLDKGASSALKRFTNMSVCWSCHTSSRAEQLKNNDEYKYMDGDAMYDPRGIPTTEGTQNWPKE
jgi:predicted CXXCH cytochrome family protein